MVCATLCILYVTVACPVRAGCDDRDRLPILCCLAGTILGIVMTSRFWLSAGFRFFVTALLLLLLVFRFFRVLIAPAQPLMTFVLDSNQREYHSATTRKPISDIVKYGSAITACAHACRLAIFRFCVNCSGERTLLLLSGLPLIWLV